MEFRDALKLFRSAAGVAQADVAAALHINISTVARWEQGKNVPNRSLAIALLEYAKSISATSECIKNLEQTLSNVTKHKLFSGRNSLFSVEHATISQLIEDASFPIYAADFETDEILYVNRAAEQLLGQSLDALAGMKCYECIMRRETPCAFCDKNQLTEDGFCGEAVCHHVNGSDYRVLGKLVKWNGRRAQVRYLLEHGPAPEPEAANRAFPGSGATQNMESDTETKWLRTIFEHINGGVSVVVYQDDGTVRFAYANDHYYELFGYTKEQFVNELKAPHDTVHPDDWDIAAAAIGNVKKTRRAATFRYRIIKRDGSVACLRCNSSVTTMDGLRGNVLISILTDITESVRLELQAMVSGQRLDAIMRHINSAVTAAMVREDGTVDFLFSNDLYYRMFGYTQAQFHAEVSSPFALAHPEDAASVRGAVLGLRHVGDTKELLYRGITRDGKIKWLQTRISMMTFPDAEGPVQLAVYSDVTDAVEAREKLDAQHDQIARLLNDTPGGIAIIEVNPKDVAGTMRTVYYNDRFYAFSGYDSEEYAALLQKNVMSFVLCEDVPILLADAETLCAGEIGASCDSTVRCHRKDGGFRWLLLTSQLAERRGDTCVIYIAMMDITEKQEAIDRQRISDEMLRIAAESDQRVLIIYDVKNNSCRVESRLLYCAKYGEIIDHIPQSLIEHNIVAPESAQELRALFARIREGERKARVSLQMRSGPDMYEWFECSATTVFDAAGLPNHAVLVFHNITEQRVKEAVFRKWRQSIDARPEASYTLFRVNLSRDASLDERHGRLLTIPNLPENISFKDKAAHYAKRCVYPDDHEAFAKLLDPDMLLAMFYRGERSASIDYRETFDDGEIMWRRLTVEMVEYPNSTDVQAFLMFEDIDEEKKFDIAARELAESDPLTGTCNRSVFADRVDQMINETPHLPCALIMLDLDGFKQINDTFGHAAGDQALQEVAAVLRAYARDGDLVCRLGGDEFMVWLRDIPYDAVIGKTAQQICEHIRKAYSQEVLLTASAGIAVYPRDGQSYEELYHNADKALYKVKQAGKDAYAFFSVIGEEQTGDVAQALSTVKPSASPPRSAKRRMLIVDDNEINRMTIKNIFSGEYLIETARNGAEAMIQLRHFGASLSVVLLDLIMPGVDGFTVLKRMQNDADLRTIPVIVVTGDEERATLLKAFELGAAEYVTKPVDVDLIRMRVQAVISKAENERLRAQNSYLMLQRNEEMKYRTVLESTGTVVIEYDWRNHVFIYDSAISKYIAGHYDHRALWQVFLTDMVADSADVQSLQDTMIALAGNREQNQASALIRLKTPEGDKHWFRVNLYKSTDAFGLTEKLIITFNDVHDEVLASDKLLFQATRDELTGLYNRAGFLAKAAELISAKAPNDYVMACINVEKFQVINDRYGTERGDEVLRHIAASVGGFVQRFGGICCRYAADKFAVLYPAQLLGKDELEENHRLVASPDCIPRPLRLRIGRCMVSETSLPVSAIFDRAAMAEAMAKGRYDTSIVDYDESMRDNILKEQQIVGDMVDALKNGEFEPWFQPQYNHATGALIGAEALVRWRKDGKIIPPNAFIPIFERNGFIYEVDQSIWRQVCATLRRWLDEGRNPLPISVNISRLDMVQENLIDVITGLVTAYDLPVELLRLEITESAFSADTETIKGIAGKLIAAGFTVEIDDFGSGYSSLNTLKDVPASILKLDMRFFEATENSARGGSIVEAVVRMAKWLGIAVIAEGVEEKSQADYLKSIGCYYIQGYYYSKPLPVKDYEKRMREGHAEHQLSHIETLESLDSDLFWDPKSMETLIFNSYVGGACIFDDHGGSIELLRRNSQYVSELRGIVPENAEIQDMAIVPYLDESSRKRFFDALHEALDSGREASSELRLTKGEQTEFLIQTSRVIAKSRDNALYYCVIQNVTERRRLERERTESAERLSIIMSNIDCGVSASVFHDESRIDIAFANDGFYKLFGYTKDQFEAEVPNVIDPILPEDRDKTTATVARIVRERGSETYEYRCRRRDGGVIWVHTTNTVVSLAGMGETVLLAVTTDITALRRAEGQSLETADRLSAVMNAMISGMTAVAFQDKRMDFLLANDQFYQLHGVEKESCRQENGLLDAMRMLHPDDRARVGTLAMQTTRVGQRCAIEYRVLYADGTLRWIRALITVTKLIGLDKLVQVAVYTDITDEKKASEQLRFLNKSASEILAQPDSEKAINDALRKLMAYFAGERAYVFELDDAAQTSDNTYEICAPGVTPEMRRLQGVPYDTQQAWLDAFRKTGFVAISDVAALADDERVMRELLRAQNIRSIIVAPLLRDGKLIGYIGVDNPAEAVDQVSQLIALADYIAVLLTRRDLTRTLDRERQTIQQLMDDTPGGFICLELFEDRNPAVVTMNDGICKMLGMTRDELMNAYGDDAYACLAEEDAAAAPDEIAQAYASGGQYTSTCQLRKKDGSLFWVMLFGRFVRGEAGKQYLNAYFTDITERRSLEQRQIELLDNLPFGAAMFSYDGKTLTAIHINKQYSVMVNRDVTDTLIGFDPVKAIHPDDRRRVFDEIRSAIAEKRNAACDIRLLYSRNEYRLFHLDASVVPDGDDQYVLYVVYERISDRDQELKETSERLKLLSDSIPGGIATFRCKPGSIEPIYFNDGVCALTGYSREEFVHSSLSILSLVFDEDKPIIRKQIELLIRGETALDCSVRIHTKSGGYKWVECMANVTGRERDTVYIVSAVLTDVTVQQEERERLLVSEKLNRLAIDQSGNIIARYDVAARTLTLPYTLPDIFNLPRLLENMPEEQVRLGRVSSDTAGVYCGVFERIGAGEACGEAVYQQNSVLGWRWLRSQFTTVFGSDGKPVSAVITFEDITEQREKEAIYTRWQNTMAERAEDSYTLVRCNLNKSSIMDSWDGTLLRVRFTDPTQPFNARTAEYTERFVYADDASAFLAFLNSDTMLAEYHRGHRSDSIDYRERNEDGSVRWLRLTVDLVEYPDSTDVEAYLLFEDIDEQKHAELFTLRRAETDPLTGVLNRVTFAQRVEQVISRSGSQACHALMMLDIDDFKKINDQFGHGAGDQVLGDIANTLTRFCRKDDLVGRLGGDEFFVFISNIGNRETAAKKAGLFCDMARKTLGGGVRISISVGVALCPQDGDAFEALYKAADIALYRTKNAGKDGYSFLAGDPVFSTVGKGHGNPSKTSDAEA